MIEVEVVYALAREQTVLSLRVPPGTTAAQAVQRSGVLHKHPSLAGRTLELGLFGQVVAPDTVLAAGDRVEIYRPLLVDPKEARRQRAAAARSGRTRR